MRLMQKPRKPRPPLRHPYADATYRAYRLESGAFGVEVSIPDMAPTRVMSFPSRTAANQWIKNHKATVQRQHMSKRPGVRMFTLSKSE